MDSTANPIQNDPHDVLVARADEELTHTHEQIMRADEEIARVHEQLSRLERDAARPPAPDRPALRGLMGLLLAACIIGAAIGWHSSYGDTARRMIARWAPQAAWASSLPPQDQRLAMQPSAPAVEMAAADPASPQPAPPDSAQLLQTMAHDLATVEQGIEQLKARQEQMAVDSAKAAEQLKAAQDQMTRDNANVAEQIKASQEQMAVVLAKLSEQNQRPKTSATSALAPRPVAAPGRKLVPAHQSAQPQAE